MSPYRGTNFFTFFWTLLERIFSGEILHPATDEIQMLVLGGVAISGALVGTFLVLRRMTMLANSLSHTILLGIVIAFLVTGQEIGALSIPVMLIASVITGLATAFLTEFLHRNIRLQEDAANGLVFSTLFALGIVLVTLFTRNAHLGVEVVMGNADALQLRDLRLVGHSRATELMLTGRMFSGTDALAWGLATEALPADDVLPRARELAHEIATHTAPISVGASKRLLWASSLSPARINDLERDIHLHLMGGADSKEGVMAHIEKRDPQWSSTLSKDWPEWLDELS